MTLDPSRTERVDRLVRLGELELSGEDEAEVDADTTERGRVGASEATPAGRLGVLMRVSGPSPSA